MSSRSRACLFDGSLLSLNDVENKKIRDGFHDPGIHFAAKIMEG